MPGDRRASDNIRDASRRVRRAEYRGIELSNQPIRSSPVRKRLWQSGLALALFMTTLAIGNFFIPAEKAVSRKSAGHDFLAFYTAGTFVREGRLDELYDLPSVRAFEREIIAREGMELAADDFGPYWNPPFFAWLFVPLSAMSYGGAWLAWFAINLICCTVAATLL